jgi:tyrosinase
VVSRFTSRGLELPERDVLPERPEDFRADLLFYGLDHSGPSFEGRVFFDVKEVDAGAGQDHPAYVGSFFIFGHGGCFGDRGHCDVPRERDAFDLRPPHQLEPATRVVTVTQPIQRLVEAGRKRVVVAVVAIAADGADDRVLTFDTVRLATYL